MSVYIIARISTIYGNQIVTKYLVFIVFIIDYKSGITDNKLWIITCIYRTEFFLPKAIIKRTILH